MKYLVTGHKGFIGSNLLKRLPTDVVKIESDIVNDDLLIIKHFLSKLLFLLLFPYFSYDYLEYPSFYLLLFLLVFYFLYAIHIKIYKIPRYIVNYVLYNKVKNNK